MSASAKNIVVQDRYDTRHVLASAPDVAIPAGRVQRWNDQRSSHVVLLENQAAETDEFNALAVHPLQSWEWGAFRQKNNRGDKAPNLMMWEAIRFGKRSGAAMFDMWGALGSNPDPQHPWLGFHRFKQGYNPALVELAGSFNLVIHPNLYRVYNRVDTIRKAILKARLRRS